MCWVKCWGISYDAFFLDSTWTLFRVVWSKNDEQIALFLCFQRETARQPVQQHRFIAARHRPDLGINYALQKQTVH